MNIKSNVTRTTIVNLNNDEFNEAIKMYLKNKGVKDTEHHVVINIIHTRDERCDELEVILKNYNKDNNITKD